MFHYKKCFFSANDGFLPHFDENKKIENVGNKAEKKN